MRAGPVGTLLCKALELAPLDAASYNYLGLLEAREGDLALALQHFETAVRLEPTLQDARYNAGVAAAELGRHDVAIRHLKAALRQLDSARVREALAMELAETGHLEEARKYFEKSP